MFFKQKRSLLLGVFWDISQLGHSVGNSSPENTNFTQVENYSLVGNHDRGNYPPVNFNLPTIKITHQLVTTIEGIANRLELPIEGLW